MRIELFYTPGCPNRALALERIRTALQSLGITEAVAMTVVASYAEAERLECPGSPTVRVNGADVDPEARTAHIYGLACRLYAGGGTREGAPPVAMIAQAILGAGPGPARRSGQTAAEEESDS